MDRRRAVRLIVATGAALLCVSSRASAQARNVRRVGFFVFGSQTSHEPNLKAFLRGMREHGYVEGRDFQVEPRWGSGDPERLAALASDLVAKSPDVIVVAGTAVTRAIRRATSAIPVVMASGSDPVETGLVKSLARPGGNITGLTNMAVDGITKLVELARAVAPSASKAAVLMTSGPAQESMWKQVQIAAKDVRLAVAALPVANLPEIEAAMKSLAGKAQVLIVQNDALFYAHRTVLAALALRLRLPSVYFREEYVEAGGLASYGSDLKDQYRRAATYVDRIFKGASAGELPIERAAVFELTLNLKTAQALGVSLPQSLLARADRVIQ